MWELIQITSLKSYKLRVLCGPSHCRELRGNIIARMSKMVVRRLLDMFKLRYQPRLEASDSL